MTQIRTEGPRFPRPLRERARVRGALVVPLVVGLALVSGCKKGHAPRGWVRTFGGAGDDMGFSVQQTRDGGYIVTGLTKSYGDTAGHVPIDPGGYLPGVPRDDDAWLLKIDSAGNKVWDKTFGGTGSDEGHSVQQTRDGGYIIAGSTSSFGVLDDDVWLIKTDTAGNKQWDRTFGTLASDGASSVQQTEDGGYIVTGWVGQEGPYSGQWGNLWLIKTDAYGNKVWDWSSVGKGDEEGCEVLQTRDGGYVVVGYTWPRRLNRDCDFLLLRFDSQGDMLWQRTYGGPKFDMGQSVVQTRDGGYLLAGYTDSYGAGSYDAWLVRTDSLGDTLWTKTLGGPKTDDAKSIRQTRDGGFMVAGAVNDGGPKSPSDVWLIKMDSGGDTVWTRTISGIGWDEANSVSQARDAGYIIVGYSQRGLSLDSAGLDFLLIKTDVEGRVDRVGSK